MALHLNVILSCLCTCVTHELTFNYNTDVQSNRKMLSLLLSKNEVASEMAVDGQEAVEMVLRDIDGFRVIFMDNMMPRMVWTEYK